MILVLLPSPPVDSVLAVQCSLRILLAYDSHLAGLLPPFIIALSNRIDKLVKTRLARGGSDLTKDVFDETVTAL